MATRFDPFPEPKTPILNVRAAVIQSLIPNPSGKKQGLIAEQGETRQIKPLKCPNLLLR
jgi:hypothetical protein